MIDILRKPDDIRIICDGENTDTSIETKLNGRKLELYVTATTSKPKFICLRWNYRTTEPTRVLGDAWERSYGDLQWRSLNGENFMPWYFLANNGEETTGCGVMCVLTALSVLNTTPPAYVPGLTCAAVLSVLSFRAGSSLLQPSSASTTPICQPSKPPASSVR